LGVRPFGCCRLATHSVFPPQGFRYDGIAGGSDFSMRRGGRKRIVQYYNVVLLVKKKIATFATTMRTTLGVLLASALYLFLCL
jgi:hypothetical protein